jgi:enoyl-CoA hydratase
MSFETIILEFDEQNAIINFNRPKVFNAYNEQMAKELTAALELVAENKNARVLILKGKGNHFMAGADINMLNAWSSLANEKGVQEVENVLSRHFSPSLLESLAIPVIAAIDGMAWGMGCEVSLGCDFRICTDRASFSQPEINLGLIPGAGSTQRLPRIVGKAKAMQIIMTGKPITAEEADRWGLVNQVVSPDELDNSVAELARQIINKSPLMIQWCKECVNHTLEKPLYDGIALELKQFCHTFVTEDSKEGTASFLEKRKPVFTGK